VILADGLDPAVFDPDYESERTSKDKSGLDHHDEEADPMLIAPFELVGQALSRDRLNTGV